MKANYIFNLGQQFDMISAAYAGRTALKYYEGRSYTYRELNDKANRFAAYLIDRELKKGDVIAILSNKTIETFALMLACAKTGVIYTNLDVSNPWQRISKILETCAPKIIFNDFEDASLLKGIRTQFDNPVVDLFSPELHSELEKVVFTDLQKYQNNINGSDPIYIMFTSGSTGFPKGALMSHDNVLNFINWGRTTFDIVPEDVFTNANPIYFDNSVFDFYVSLFSGASMVPLKTEMVKDSKVLVSIVNECKCTFWFSVPSLLIYLLTTKALQDNDLRDLTRIAFGGEGFPKPKLKKLYDLFGKRIRLYNVYGPTECTCICSSYLIHEGDFENMQELAPLGHLAPNFGYEILPFEGNIHVGELALTGPNVGLGYYNDAERTNKSFVQNPEKPFFQRMYRTGDLVEKRENGYLYFKGRVDNQIKHMGYRIELEEVEAAINSLKYVDESCAVYKKISEDLGFISAYLSVNAQNNASDIERDLAGILPPYMLPKKIIIMDKLPKNRNGKIDRNQLNQA